MNSRLAVKCGMAALAALGAAALFYIGSMDNSAEIMMSNPSDSIETANINYDSEASAAIHPDRNDNAPMPNSDAPNGQPATSEEDPFWPERPDLARELRQKKETAGQQESPLGPEHVAARALALQPSVADMLNMDSAEVARELVFSPLQVSILHMGASGPDQQLSGLASWHQGVDILLSRPDAGAALLATYRTYSDAIADPAGDYVEIGSSGLEFATIETLLGAEAVLDQIGEAGQLPTLIEAVIEAVDRQAVYDASQPEPVYGEAMRNNAATVVGRSLVRLQDPAFLEWLSAPGREGVLTERHPTYEESATILEMGAAFSSSRNVVETRE